MWFAGLGCVFGTWVWCCSFIVVCLIVGLSAMVLIALGVLLGWFTALVVVGIYSLLVVFVV